MSNAIQSPIHGDSLADVLERVLDKGVVIAGDVVVSLVGIELLSIKLRLLITTVDKAQEMGINWWEADPQLSTEASTAHIQTETLERENRELRGRLAILEKRMTAMGA